MGYISPYKKCKSISSKSILFQGCLDIVLVNNIKICIKKIMFYTFYMQVADFTGKHLPPA